MCGSQQQGPLKVCKGDKRKHEGNREKRKAAHAIWVDLWVAIRLYGCMGLQEMWEM